jgi:CheY-like chemotaxis protein/two-component sensor histidine kinase
VRHLNRLVDDLLDVARVASGKVELKREVIELSSIVSQSVEQTRALFESKRHTLRTELPAGLLVNVDATRLAQVVTNLLVNAAKYTDPGGTVVVSAAADGGDAVLRVRDNGVGIPEHLMPHIFDMFVQGRQSSDRALGGLGLGLTLVRSIVELHGGRVVATSKAGVGSDFVVRLPLAAEQRTAVSGPAIGAVPAKPLRVLIVDDNEDAADLLAMYLADLGLTPRVARDGVQALALVDELEPDVALLDLGLPGMDGYELGRRLRARPAKHRITIVAVSGYGQESDVARAKAAGFDGHLVKPVDLDKLARLLAAR